MPTTGVSINASGVDTETLIQSSIQSDQDRYDKLYKQRVEQEWTKEQYNEVYNEVKDYWNNDTSNYKLSSYTTARTASSTNSDAVTATVTADAVEMTHDVNVNALASAAYLQTYDKVDLGLNNNAGDLATMAGITIPSDKTSSDDIALSFTINDSSDGEGTVISFTYKELAEGKTLNDLASRINRSGLNLSAVYDSTNQSFSITNKDTGADNLISISTDVSNNPNYLQAVSSIGETKASLDAAGFSDYSTLDSLIKAKTDAADILKYSSSSAGDSYTAAQEASAAADKAYADFVAAQSDDVQALLSQYTESKDVLDRYGVEADYQNALIDKEQAAAKLEQLAVSNGYDGSDDAHPLFNVADLDKLLQEGDATKINDYVAKFSSIDTEIQDYITKYNEFASKTNSATDNSQKILDGLGFASYNSSTGSFEKVAAGALTGGVYGTNGSVTIDGKTYDNLSSNSINVANVNYTFNSVTTSTTRISVSTDKDALVESVQNFVDSYNELLDMLNEKVHETYYSDYGALTEDEESAMTESQLEKWNDKAQSGLLRKSTQLQTIIDAMREAISTPIEGIDGDYNSLASIGVSASGDWDEYGHLYIDTDKLNTALNEDPDVFYKIMSTNTKEYETQGVAFRLSDIMRDGMSAIEDEAGTTTDSDDQSFLGLRIQNYNTRLDSLQDLIDRRYDYYYQKYSAMEQAISNMQSSMNTLSSYLGLSS